MKFKHLFEFRSQVQCELRQYLKRSGCPAQSNESQSTARIFDPYSNPPIPVPTTKGGPQMFLVLTIVN